jgi:hypothetical protein
MAFLEVRPAVQPRGTYRDEVHVVRHHFGQLAGVVLGPCVREGLWNFAHSLLVGFRLAAEGRGYSPK